jgi:siroheme synthase-like protein
MALLDAGATVRMVASNVCADVVQLESTRASFSVIRAAYASAQLGDASLVVAATDNRTVNARVAADARGSGRLVSVVDAPELGNYTAPAVHRTGDVVVAVSAGGVPGAAARIRDAIARSIDGRYSAAVRELAALRRSLLGDDRRDRWAEASSALIGSDFCKQVESGGYPSKVAEWR